MLDVHPPHEAAHSWKDFFIHIATIVIGLLIAVGLEQTVEHIHEHIQVREARAMLRDEMARNRRNLAEDAPQIDAHLAQLWKDLAVVARARAHESLPGDQILFVRSFTPFQSAAWQTIHASNVSEHMNPQELAGYGYLYQMQQDINDRSGTVGNQLQDSLAPLVASEDPRMQTTAQIQEIESHLHSAKDMAKANHLLSYDNHPERLTPGQFDSVELALQQGITADRRMQRFLAALGADYDEFRPDQVAR
jgi:hypothetical protein